MNRGADETSTNWVTVVVVSTGGLQSQLNHLLVLAM